MLLKKLGVTELEEILSRGHQNPQCFIGTSGLRRQFGRAVETRHMIALNRLALLLNNDSGHHNFMAYISSTDLSIEQRLMHPEFAITPLHPMRRSADAIKLSGIQP